MRSAVPTGSARVGGRGPSPSLNAANATAARNAVSGQETFVLRATPSIKRYHIARFDVPNMPEFCNWSQPVMMYPEPEKINEEDEEEAKQDEASAANGFGKRRRRRRRRDPKLAGWVIEDKDGKNKFNGSVEGGQSSMYMLLIRNRPSRKSSSTSQLHQQQEEEEFSVMPVEHWFRFKKPLGYRTLTLEEAEELNNEKKRAVERWLMRHKMAGEDNKGDDDSTVNVVASRMRTGALGGGARTSVKKEADDLFDVSAENKPKRTGFRPAKRANEGDPTGEDGGDFDEKFDDDESDAEIMADEPPGLQSESEEEEIGEADAAGKLTETGQAMKDLLKRAQSGEMLDNNGDDKQDKDDDNSDEDDYSAQDMDKIRRDLGGNIIRDRSTEASGSGANGGSEEAKAGAGAAGGPGVANGNAANDSQKQKTPTNDSANANNKRKLDASGKSADEPTQKQSKSSVSSSISSATKLTEAGVQQELIRYGGRMRTTDLLRKLRKLIVTDNDKALLKDILRTICEMEVDAIDGKMLVLKSQFR